MAPWNHASVSNVLKVSVRPTAAKCPHDLSYRIPNRLGPINFRVLLDMFNFSARINSIPNHWKINQKDPKKQKQTKVHTQMHHLIQRTSRSRYSCGSFSRIHQYTRTMAPVKDSYGVQIEISCHPYHKGQGNFKFWTTYQLHVFILQLPRIYLLQKDEFQ